MTGDTKPREPHRHAGLGPASNARQAQAMREIEPCVYIMASRRLGTLYVGVTSNLPGRVLQHREGTFKGFTEKHGVKMLVWYEAAPTMEAAIAREKTIKKWRRDWKCNLIEQQNPEWRDLSSNLGLPSLA